MIARISFLVYSFFMKSSLSVISWNVNGIRANFKKGGWAWLIGTGADIIAVQETKAHPDQLPEEVRNPKGYFAFFDHSKVKKGYSGVAFFTKHKPDTVEYGVGVEELDQEGRFLALFYEKAKIVFINTYFPNGGGGPERLDFKLRFYDAFLAYCLKLRKKGYGIIFMGDVNTAHTEIDLARPKDNAERTGFLPIERAWIDQVIEKNFVDIYRHLHPQEKDKYTYWDMKTFARDRNVGWRIDYFFVSDNLKDKIRMALIKDEILGSDHCPIEIVANIELSTI